MVPGLAVFPDIGKSKRARISGRNVLSPESLPGKRSCLNRRPEFWHGQSSSRAIQLDCRLEKFLQAVLPWRALELNGQGVDSAATANARNQQRRRA